MTKKITFVGTCVELQADDLHAYDDRAREIGYGTFVRHLGADVINEIRGWLGYARSERQGLTLKRDWHVRYSKGKWKGQPAVCMMHSAIHHIWLVQ